jgi:pimeloyl-ACP methyl ester carboxylesterase
MAASGHWWEPEGQRIVQTTLDWLAARGKKQVVLAGLSNGGVGTSVLARTFERRLVGAIALSGTKGAGPRKLPMLVLHGMEDSMTSPENARRFAKAHPRRTWASLPGGHFALLYERDTARDVIARWLRQLLP